MDNEIINLINKIISEIHTLKESIEKVNDKKEKKGKVDLYVDMDGCVFNTIKCIVDLYNEDFQYYNDFVKIKWTDVKSWDFKELSFANKDYINAYFNQQRFFDNVEMMDGVEHVLQRIIEDDRVKIHFCSSGYSPNLLLKDKWVKEHYPMAEFIGVDLEKYEDKSHVDMSGGIFIDDVIKNLATSNARFKICFGDIYEWNKANICCYRCFDWADTYKTVNLCCSYIMG